MTDAEGGEDEPLWPVSQLLASLAAREGAVPERGFAVVSTTGAMNPPHRGHMQLLHQAKARLELEGFTVLAAWMSPSHDAYVQPKAKSLGTPGLSSDFRLEIAKRIAAGDELVAVGAWEAKQPGGWPDYPEVVVALQKALEQVDKLQDFPLTTFYACGTDHAGKCGLYRGLDVDATGVVVIPRTGETPRPESAQHLVFVAEPSAGDVAAISSTKIRTALAQGDFETVAACMSQDAARFLMRPTAAEFSRFEAEYQKIGITEAVA